MILNSQTHVFNLSLKGANLCRSILFMLLLTCFHASNLILHDMENVLALSFSVEDGACQFFSFLNSLSQDSLLSLQNGSILIANFNSRLDHVSANRLNARFDIEPVELVYFVLCKFLLRWLLNYDCLY